jgi:LuxR family maltose regulon positive regulatory protein
LAKPGVVQHPPIAEYVTHLLAAFDGPQSQTQSSVQAQAQSQPPVAQRGMAKQPLIEPLIEPLSERELQVLQLVAQGLSNREIGERLFLSVNTVKGHNRVIFGKLQVQRRTEAVARARELGLV